VTSLKIRQGKSSLGGWGAGNQERAEAFRRTHHVGQKVHGRLIRWEGPGLAWVNIGNQPLLAQIQSRPAHGARLTFIIKKLKPEIMLKEIFGGSQAGLPVFDLIKDFTALRAEFEAAGASIWSTFSAGNNESVNRQSFFEKLKNDEDTALAFQAVTASAARINSFLASNETFFYWPWMQPGGRSQAAVVRRKPQDDSPDMSFFEMTNEFESANFGLVQINTLYRHPTVGYRILAQILPHAGSIKRRLTPLPFPGNLEVNCIGLERLPANKHGGILSELLLSSS